MEFYSDLDEYNSEYIAENSCRICLNICPANAKSSEQFLNTYLDLTGFQIDLTDIPKKICQNCVKTLNSFVVFKEMCKNTERIIQGDRLSRVKMEDGIIFESIEELAIQHIDLKKEMEYILPNDYHDSEKSKAVKPSRRKPYGLCDRFIPDKGKEVSVQETRRFECAHCPATYKCKREVLKHLRQKHTLSKPEFPCKYCGQVFTIWSTRYYHILKKHENTPRFECPICLKTFVNATVFNNHVKAHSDSRDYKCLQCEKAFTTNTYLRRHLKEVHSKYRNFFCSICNGSFKCSKSLRQHMNTHKNNCYSCPICHHTYSVGKSLKIHIENKHPEVKLPPPGTILKNNPNFLETQI